MTCDRPFAHNRHLVVDNAGADTDEWCDGQPSVATTRAQYVAAQSLSALAAYGERLSLIRLELQTHWITTEQARKRFVEATRDVEDVLVNLENFAQRGARR